MEEANDASPLSLDRLAITSARVRGFHSLPVVVYSMKRLLGLSRCGCAEIVLVGLIQQEIVFVTIATAKTVATDSQCFPET